MPRDFDKERSAGLAPVEDRQFTIGGETFTIRAKVRPDVIAPYLQMVSGAGETMTEDDVIGLLDTLMANLIMPGEEKKWEKVRAISDPDKAVSTSDLRAVVNWSLGVTSGRPTEPSSDSSDGSPTTGTGTASTDASRLQAVTSA